MLGAGIQHLSVAAVVLGWGIAEAVVMINTVAICRRPILIGSLVIDVWADAYCNDCFPRRQVGVLVLTTNASS